MRTAVVWFLHLLVLVTAANNLPQTADLGSHTTLHRGRRQAAAASVVGVASVSASAAAVFAVSHFIYGVINGQSQLTELKSLERKMADLQTFVDSRFHQLSNKMDVLRIEALYGKRVS